EKPRTRVFPNQLCNRRLAITGNLWEDLFGDREDVPNGLVRKPIVENSCFVRSGSESLDNQWSCGSVQVIADLGLVLHNFHASTALANVRFENHRIIEAAAVADFTERFEAVLWAGALKQFRFGRELGAGLHQISQRGDFGFTHQTAGKDAWVRGRG